MDRSTADILEQLLQAGAMAVARHVAANRDGFSRPRRRDIDPAEARADAWNSAAADADAYSLRRD